MPKKIAIIGHGYVGQAMHAFFDKHYDVRVLDPKYRLCGCNVPKVALNAATMAAYEPQDMDECDIGVICLPTQSNEDGSCDTSLVDEAVRSLKTPLVLIKSTVSPGTTDRLKKETGKRIVFSPEYCGESTYWSEYKFHTDVKETPWFTFGGDSKDTSEMASLFMKVAGPTKVYHQTEAITAELAKYVENSFYAMKVTFCYEIANVCEKLGVDYMKMREAWLLDPRINKMHTAVFAENDNPFGGKCFPKDLRAIVYACHKAGYDANLLKEVLKSNDRIGAYRKSKRPENGQYCV